jgi:hypothetical protein
VQADRGPVHHAVERVEHPEPRERRQRGRDHEGEEHDPTDHPLEREVAGQQHREPHPEDDLEAEGDAGEDERVLDGLPEGLVGEDVPVVLQAHPAAGRAHPVVGEAEVDRHPEREGDEGREQDERGHDEAVAEDVLLLPPLAEPREAAGPREPGRLQNARPDRHG